MHCWFLKLLHQGANNRKIFAGLIYHSSRKSEINISGNFEIYPGKSQHVSIKTSMPGKKKLASS